jgi:hypothetical protein
LVLAFYSGSQAASILNHRIKAEIFGLEEGFLSLGLTFERAGIVNVHNLVNVYRMSRLICSTTSLVQRMGVPRDQQPSLSTSMIAISFVYSNVGFD